MAYGIDEDDFIETNMNFNKLFTNIYDLIFELFYYFIKYIILFFELIIETTINTKKNIINNCLKNTIYQIDYINIDNNNSYTIYKLNIFYKFYLYLIGFKFIKYYIDEYIKYDLKKLISLKYNGFLNIKYYNNDKLNHIFLNLNAFKNNNFLFKHTDLLIINVIHNFITNHIVYEDDNILYIEIKNNKNNTDITKLFLKYKNSFKDNNIKLFEFLKLLEIVYNITSIKNNIINKFNLTLTNKFLDEKIYNIDDYINLKTFYEDLADNEIKK